MYVPWVAPGSDESSLAIDQISTDGWLALVSMFLRSCFSARPVMSSMYALLWP